MENQAKLKVDAVGTECAAITTSMAGVKCCTLEWGNTGGTGGAVDEPPVIIGGGSLYIDVPHDRKLKQDGTPDTTKPRPYRKVLESGADVMAIGLLRVLTLTREGNPVNYMECKLDRKLYCQLHVWLEQLKEGATDDNVVFEPANPENSGPQLVIKGEPFMLEVDKDIVGPQNTYKQRTPYRYVHPGYTGRHFRIKRWRLIGMSGGVPETLKEGQDEDNYILFVSFHHVDRQASAPADADQSGMHQS